MTSSGAFFTVPAVLVSSERSASVLILRPNTCRMEVTPSKRNTSPVSFAVKKVVSSLAVMFIASLLPCDLGRTPRFGCEETVMSAILYGCYAVYSVSGHD